MALTRAQEKLILNGHLRLKNGAASADGWLGGLLEAGGMLPGALLAAAGTWQRLDFPGGGEWALYLAPLAAAQLAPAPLPAPAWPESAGAPLFGPLPGLALTDQALAPLLRTGPASERRRSVLEPQTPPARVVGELVHKALQRWRFPGDPQLERLLQALAREEGLVRPELVERAVRESEALLRRFQRHHLYAEMDAAPERLHELPYVGTDPQGKVEWGFMDCLYRTQAGWTLVDFKTDDLRRRAELEGKVKEYRPQIVRYRAAAESLLGAPPRALMVFLNVEGQIWEEEVGGELAGS